jgi:hypothetical protein
MQQDILQKKTKKQCNKWIKHLNLTEMNEFTILVVD